MQRHLRDTEHLDPVPTDVGRALYYMAAWRIIAVVVLVILPILGLITSCVLYVILKTFYDVWRLQ